MRLQVDGVQEAVPYKRPTLRDIAKITGISVQAVSQALGDYSGTVKVSAATKSRVRQVAEEIGYRKDTIAQALRRGRSGAIGVLGFRARHGSFVERLFHTFTELGRLKLIPSVHLADPKSKESCLQACHDLLDSKVDGVVILAPPPGGEFTQAHVQMFQERGIPVVTVAGSWLTNVMSFAHDIQDAYEKIGRHLVAEGFRSITLMCLDPSGPQLHRQKMLSGFRNAQEEARLAGRDVAFDVFSLPSEAEISKLRVDDIHELYKPGYVGMKRLIERGRLPEALMCQVDNIALGAMRACGEAGIRVPEDLALTGFGDYGDSSSGYIPLTTVSNDLEQICHLAIERLHKTIEEKSRTGSQNILVSGRLIIRRSSKRGVSPR